MSATTEKKWIGDFIIELRLREVRGDAIGDAVAVVKELLDDSGQDPLQAFGTPRHYADQLDLPLVEGAGLKLGATLAPALGTLALLVYIPAVWAFFGGEPLGYSLPQLLMLMVPLLAIATLPLYIEKLVRRFWAPVAALGICVAAAIASMFFKSPVGTDSWFSADALIVSVLSGLVLLAASIWGMYETARTPDDPIVDPLSTPRKTSPLARLMAAVLPHAMLPLVALIASVTARLA